MIYKAISIGEVDNVLNVVTVQKQHIQSRD
jgi:hypothetical protein